jgi:hypothetical protein
MNVVIKDEDGHLLYGHQLLNQIIKTKKGTQVYLLNNVPAEAYIVYISHRFPQCKEVQTLQASHMIDYQLLEAISDIIELSEDDCEAIEQLSES